MDPYTIQKQRAQKVLRSLRMSAKLRGRAEEGAVTAHRITLRKRDRYGLHRERIVYKINGNRVSAIDAAKFLAPDCKLLNR